MKANSRRDFLKKTTAASAAITVGGVLPGLSAKSYGRVYGANETVRVSVMGVHSRGKALAKNFARQKGCDVLHICDVDSRTIPICQEEVAKVQDLKTKGFGDFRKSLESKEIDAMVIATPDHWHAPAALMAVQAGKHVYLEKPSSHNPAEGEILVKATEKYNRVIQLGTQRRSFPVVIEGIKKIQDGIIGRPYFGRCWYANNRGTIGTGKAVPVPEWLNWDLWQGPAPRKEYKDNIVHYNWHWRWIWGTGEALNNGTHVVDLLRWGFNVDYPTRVSSDGGRYRYEDDWQTPDTQVITIDFNDKVTMSWEGRSCNGMPEMKTGAGAIFYGEKGSVFFPGGNDYTVYDLDGNVVKKEDSGKALDTGNLVSPFNDLDAYHINNFFDGIRKGRTVLHADIAEGVKSTLLVQLGNIAQRVGHSLEIDPRNGHIKDQDAQIYWSRIYEKGWEMKL